MSRTDPPGSGNLPEQIRLNLGENQCGRNPIQYRVPTALIYHPFYPGNPVSLSGFGEELFD